MGGRARIAVLDDYQGVALAMADWARVQSRADVTVFSDHVADVEQLVTRLSPFEVLCVMRERTPLPRALLERLPNLKLICSTGHRNASINLVAAQERGIILQVTGYTANATAELTWALILGGARHLVEEVTRVRQGGWQRTIGEDLEGKTLGILGLGTLGARVAKVALAFGMSVIAWSQNLTAAHAEECGARLVTKEQLFAQADVLTVHLVLSPRTRGLVGAHQLSLMKPTARLVNTSRGPIVDNAALLEALNRGVIAGAALDVYDTEPLPTSSPLRTMPNLITTPHIGYVTHDTYRRFYGDTVAHLERWLDAR